VTRHKFHHRGHGYIGRSLIPELRALVRSGSEGKLPSGVVAVAGNALDRSTFVAQIAPSDTFIQLVGVPHPSPPKADQFRAIDLVSIRESVPAAKQAGVKYFVYLSVAQPAPVMKDYVAVRAEGERLMRESGMRATFVRPWYVLGPGHRWPYLILPLYWIWSLSPKSRDTARRLYPVKLRSVVRAIADAVDAPPDGVRIIEAPKLRRA
jgi:uncharacterized protein YbjT (DUF2867 family)